MKALCDCPTLVFDQFAPTSCGIKSDESNLSDSNLGFSCSCKHGHLRRSLRLAVYFTEHMNSIIDIRILQLKSKSTLCSLSIIKQRHFPISVRLLSRSVVRGSPLQRIAQNPIANAPIIEHITPLDENPFPNRNCQCRLSSGLHTTEKAKHRG